MAIIKKAINMFSQIEEDYNSIAGDFREVADLIIIDSLEENLSINSNKKIQIEGKVESQE